jgi:tetratricopeptide (TPR) repeat protein
MVMDMPKIAFVVVLALAASLPAPASARLEEVASTKEILLYQGQVDEFTNQLLSSADRSDASHLVEVGNYLYRLDLQRTIELHKQALKITPFDAGVLIELGYDYTAAERCQDAAKSWDAVEESLISGNTAAIASYCHVVLGNYDRALELWERSDYLSHHVGVEKAIHNVFGRPDPALKHAEGFRTYAAKGWGGASEWVRNAIFWQSDWWNVSANQRALESIRSELETRKDAVGLRELACAVSIEDLPPSEALEATRECGFLDANDSTPRNSGVAYAVAVRIGSDQLPELKERWGSELLRRAKSGDSEALNLLAALLAAADDNEMLAEIDELGWKQFKISTFALSRLYGLGIGSPGNLPDALARRLARSAETFPFDARLQMLSLVRLRPTGVAYRDALARLIVAEFHSLSHSSELSAQPNARGLDGFFGRLGAAQHALAEGKVPSVDEPDGG